MAWEIYKEYTDFDLSNNFSMSFDFSLDVNETLGIGVRDKPTLPLLKPLANFSKNLKTNIILSSSPDVFEISKSYQYENGLIVKKEDDNSSFFGNNTRIINNKVYEEVKDVSKFDKNKYTDYFVEKETLYVHYPQKYEINDKKKIGLIFKEDSMSFIFSSYDGTVFDEKYLLDGTFRGDKKKTRITITNAGKLVNISQKNDFFSTLFYIQFPDGIEHGYFFAGTEAPNDLNSLMTDLSVFGTKNS